MPAAACPPFAARPFPHCSRAEHLLEHFGQFGTVIKVIVNTKKNGESRGFGFIHYKYAQEADAACHYADHTIDGKAVCVMRGRGYRRGRG